MSLNKLYVIFLGFMLSCLSIAKEIKVCDECRFTRIAEAIDSAEFFDTLFVYTGVYFESEITIRKPLIILGKGEPIIDAEYKGEIMTIFSDGVIIEGIQFRNIGASYMKEHAAIRIVNSKHCIIANNHLNDTFFGIYLQEADSCKILNNKITGRVDDKMEPGNAIHLWKCKGITVSGNMVSGHRDGIYFEFVSNSYIIDNVSKQNQRYGLHFMFSHSDLYQGNLFDNNGAGVAVMFSDSIRMIGNLFKNNWGGAAYGILLKEIKYGEMTANKFVGNTRAIYAEGTNNLAIKNNDLINNGWAVDIKGNSLDNEFIGNNFISNTFDVITNSQQNPNIYIHNYWSKHPGFDLNKDGYADRPYHPVSLFSLIVGKIPAAGMLLESMLAGFFDYAEKVFPGLTPEAVVDSEPLLKPINNDTPSSDQQIISKGQGTQPGHYQL